MPDPRPVPPIRNGWPLGFITVDLDGLWALRKCYGQPRRDSFVRDPIWEDGVPWLLDTFERLGIRATFLVVARDLEVDSKRDLAREILRRGHEIANHSLAHRIGLTRLPMGELMEDLRASQQMFEEALDMRPVGFRSPGYDVDARLLRAARRAGFLYDSSLLPTWWGPLFRAADWWVARRINLGKRQFGRFRYGWAPLRPYQPLRFAIRQDGTDDAAWEASTTRHARAGKRAWRDTGAVWSDGEELASTENSGDGLETRSSRPNLRRTDTGKRADVSGGDARRADARIVAGDFWEIPISVTPGLRLPIGAGYVLMAGKGYLPRAVRAIQKRDLPLVFLLHGADVTDLRRGEDRVFVSRAMQPTAAGFALPGDTKRRRIGRALASLADTLRLSRMGDWVKEQTNAEPEDSAELP